MTEIDAYLLAMAVATTTMAIGFALARARQRMLLIERHRAQVEKTITGIRYAHFRREWEPMPPRITETAKGVAIVRDLVRPRDFENAPPPPGLWR